MTSRVCSKWFAAMIFTIMVSDGRGSDTESLPNFDEFLASSFKRYISDNEKFGEQEKADSLGLDLRALSLQT